MVTRGTQFSKKLRSLPSEQQKPCRIVPAFTLQSLQKGTCITPPPKLNIYAETKYKEENLFKMEYRLGMLPIIRNPNGKMYTWKEDLNNINYARYLPTFFEGLLDLEEPFNSIAKNCIADLLNFSGAKVLAVIPLLIVPLRKALKTKNKKIMINTLKVLQDLIKSHFLVGEALLPYYSQLLPVLNLYKERNVNCGEQIDKTHSSGENLADVINDTLGIIEEHSGPHAFPILKRIFPTYESQV